MAENSEQIANQNKKISNKGDFIDFLAEVANKLNEAIISNPQLKSSIIKHIDKVMKEAQKYKDYLNRKYNEAKKKGLLTEDPIPKGKNWYFCDSFDTVPSKPKVHISGEPDIVHVSDLYFDDDVIAEVKAVKVRFWMKGMPDPDPFDYLESMVMARVGSLYKGLELIDYQSTLLAIIYDAQNWQAGSERIYFNPDPNIDTPIHKQNFEDRICVKIWHNLTKDDYLQGNDFDKVAHKIKTALLVVQQASGGKADLPNEKPEETEQKTTPAKIINIENFKGILGDVQAENVQTGNHASTHKQTVTAEKKKGILKKILKWLVGIIGTIVVTDILSDLGLIKWIRIVFHNILTHR